MVKKEPFQDLYLILKDRHRHLDSRAPKAGSTKIEDVKRHVYKVSHNTSLCRPVEYLGIKLTFFPLFFRFYTFAK
jgi:hypothetical protein